MLQYFENQKNDNTYFEVLIKKLTNCKFKIRDWSEELDKNVKNKASKKIQRIDIFEKIIKLQDDLDQSKNDQYKEFLII